MTVFYDVFNGDADGICALHQLRLVEPRESVLVTGAKRDIHLVACFDANAGDEITVLDISLAVNNAALRRQLERGAQCRYFDHHNAGDIPAHPNLKTFIDTSSDVCTSLIVDRYLGGRQRIWAVVAAFGDNLAPAAVRAAADFKLSAVQLAQLRELGECLNYNAYGDSVEDLNYHPADLYQTLRRYPDPFAFISGEPILDVLRSGYADDMFRANEIAPEAATPQCALYILPDAPWARRVSGSFGNRLAQRHPARAHAVLTRSVDGYRVSVRAAIDHPQGADALCSQFEGGGGRRAAAGINWLPAGDLERFARSFKQAYAP